MKPAITCLALVLCGTAAFAAEPMSGPEFEAYTTGKTLSYGTGGAPYGAEQYLQNRRVVWSFLDGQCKDGRWYVDAANICFVYEDQPDPQCWQFFETPEGLRAQYQGGGSSSPLYEVGESEEPLFCLGPEVGA